MELRWLQIFCSSALTCQRSRQRTINCEGMSKFQGLREAVGRRLALQRFARYDEILRYSPNPAGHHGLG